MRHYSGEKIVENLDKPIMAFAGTIAGRAGMKLMDKAFASMNPKMAEFAKAAVVTTGSLLGYQKASEQRSDNAQYFFVGMAAAGVGKAVEVISGGELNGWIEGLGSTAEALPEPDDIYVTDTGMDVDYDYSGSDLHLPVLDPDTVTTTSEAMPISGSVSATDEAVEDVDYEEVYEID